MCLCIYCTNEKSDDKKLDHNKAMTGFYMVTASVMKELNIFVLLIKNGDEIGDVTASHNEKRKTSEDNNIDNKRYNEIQKQTSSGVPRKRCSENM